MRTPPAVIAISLLCATPAAAQEATPPTAQTLAAEGVELGKLGKYAEAADAFKKAFELEPKATYLCNVGMAFYGANDFERAHLYLAQCFRKAGAPVAGMVKPLEYAVSQLETGGFGKVSLTSNPSGAEVALSSLAGELRFTTPLVVYLPVGKHTVELTLADFKPAKQTLIVAAKVQQNVLVAMTADEKPPPVLEPEPEPEPKLPVEPVEPTVQQPSPLSPPQPGESRWKRKSAWIFAGSSAAALGLAIGARVRAGQLNADLLEDCELCPLIDGPDYNSARTRINRWYYSSLALFAISGGLAVTSAVLFALPIERGGGALAVTPRPGGAMLQLSVFR